MISSKIYSGDGTTTRFLSDFIIRSEQFARPYVYYYDPNVPSDVLESGSTNQADWSYPDNLWIRKDNTAQSNDVVTTDKWAVVDNSILFYVAPPSGSVITLEVATTPEEFGDTLTQPSVKRAEDAAVNAEQSASEAATHAKNAKDAYIRWVEEPTVTVGMTSYSSSRDLTNVNVYLNGILLQINIDYTNPTYNSILLVNPIEAIDDVFYIVGTETLNQSGGATGSFTTTDGKTVTVKSGLITSIV